MPDDADFAFLDFLQAEGRRRPADIDLAGHHRGQRAGRTAGRRRLGLDPEFFAEGAHDIVRTRSVGRIGDGVARRRVLQALDRRIRLHVPIEIAGAGEGRRQDADRRAFGERAHDAGDADADADIGRAGDDSLHGFTGALRADSLDDEVVLLEDAGILAERRRLVFPIVDLADRELERVLRGGGLHE